MRLPIAAALIVFCVSASASALERIAYGACNFQLMDQSHWSTIARHNPDLWIWMGDNIYADYLKPSSREREYNRLKNDPHYAAFRNQVRIIGTWDDHDFGHDSAGAEYVNKVASQRLALDFLDEPADSPRRKQEGIYTTYLMGEPGEQVRILLLDARYFRTQPGPTEDLLGSAQWKWLEGQLKSTGSEELRILVSGSQIIPQEYGGDHWEKFPTARSRLLGLAAASPVPTVLLSGDVHFGEVSRFDHGARTVFEHTSSGLTHKTHSKSIANRHRVGSALLERNFGVMELNWTRTVLEVEFQIRAIDGKLFDSHRIRYSRNPSRALWDVTGWF